jgi:hypothetical protein
MPKGRRPCLDNEKRREICAILAVGCTRTIAARYVGCHVKTIRNTARRDAEFARAIEQAETKHEIMHLTHINKAAGEGRFWRAAAWALERRYPDRYARRRPHTITIEQMSHALDQFAGVVFEEVTDPEHRQRILQPIEELTAQLQQQIEKGAGHDRR